ncbi:hypothetical protein BDP27DRAFT_1372448 [Rhodocollybia butyracea]|uniref:Uncharacterized protein n=1 Tax=Rhodocollybia butyracea TaxID=206335 RepID=A0A9P5TXA4_9AGAR|nr:hypothetical protein BDP27DRAFT_1372448 [Rhodocollybia butyracea]
MPFFWTLAALSFLSALCILTAQAAPDTMPSHQELATRQTTVTNPYMIGPFAAGSQAFMTSTAHAAFLQRVMATGSGEGVNMVVLGSSPATTQCALAATSTTLPLPIEVTFQFAGLGSNGIFSNTPVVKASTSVQGFTTMISVQTEDSTDNDNNDSEVIINVQSPPTRIAVPQAVSSASLEGALVESDLFFKPTDSISVSVGAFSGESTLSDFSASTQDWAKVTGEILNINQEPSFLICSP